MYKFPSKYREFFLYKKWSLFTEQDSFPVCWLLKKSKKPWIVKNKFQKKQSRQRKAGSSKAKWKSTNTTRATRVSHGQTCHPILLTWRKRGGFWGSEWRAGRRAQFERICCDLEANLGPARWSAATSSRGNEWLRNEQPNWLINLQQWQQKCWWWQWCLGTACRFITSLKGFKFAF